MLLQIQNICDVCMLSLGFWVQVFVPHTIFVIVSFTHPQEEVWPGYSKFLSKNLSLMYDEDFI